jgi:hypothetical protein
MTRNRAEKGLMKAINHSSTGSQPHMKFFSNVFEKRKQESGMG